MKILPPLLALLCAASAHAGFVTTIVTFDNLTSQSVLGTSFSTGGLTFSSPTTIVPVTGSLASDVFTFGSTPTHSPGIEVDNHGWLTIATTPGQLMTDVTLDYGFSWNSWAITNNIMDEFFWWEEFNGDTLVALGQSGAQQHPGTARLTSDAGFDRLLIRSTAIQYEVTSTNGYTFQRTGKVLSATDENRIALDTITATYDPPDAASVFDGGATAALLAIGLAALLGFAPPRVNKLKEPVQL